VLLLLIRDLPLDLLRRHVARVNSQLRRGDQSGDIAFKERVPQWALRTSYTSNRLFRAQPALFPPHSPPSNVSAISAFARVSRPFYSYWKRQKCLSPSLDDADFPNFYRPRSFEPFASSRERERAGQKRALGTKRRGAGAALIREILSKRAPRMGWDGGRARKEEEPEREREKSDDDVLYSRLRGGRKRRTFLPPILMCLFAGTARSGIVRLSPHDRAQNGAFSLTFNVSEVRLL